LICAGTHAYVCPEHFREWVVYGIFFMAASVIQAAWSILVLVRPSRHLLLAGAIGNTLVVVTFVISRTIGIPFGPEPFSPESFDALSSIVTACEVAVIAVAGQLLLRRERSFDLAA
jgi:hypothetical protein